MNKFFKLVAPTSRKGIVVNVFLFLFAVAACEILFAFAYDGTLVRDFNYYFTHTVFVGGPFVLLFVTGSAHQLALIRRLSLLSRKDGLTGLNNRRTFLELAQKRLDQARHGVLILLDADHFKRVNDKYGHAIGDHCLEEIAHRLKWNLRGDDVAGRMGGEEFAIFFAGATIEQARVIGARIGQPIPFRAGEIEKHLSITLSMGAVQIDPSVSLDLHLIRADEALYAAKNAGRARMVVWSDDIAPNPSQSGSTVRLGNQNAA